MMDLPNNPFSRQFRDAIEDMRTRLDRAEQTIQSLNLEAANAYGRTPFKITGHSATSSSYPVWTYSGTQQKPKSATGTNDDWDDASDPITLSNTLVNDLEQGSDSTHGYAYNMAYSGGYWYFTDTDMTAVKYLPVPTGIIVWAKCAVRPDNTVRWHFSAPNQILPGC